MTAHDPNTRIVYTEGTGAGWFVAILLLIAVAIGGIYLYNAGAFTDRNDVNVTIDVPDNIIPGEPQG